MRTHCALNTMIGVRLEMVTFDPTLEVNKSARWIFVESAKEHADRRHAAHVQGKAGKPDWNVAGKRKVVEDRGIQASRDSHEAWKASHEFGSCSGWRREPLESFERRQNTIWFLFQMDHSGRMQGRSRETRRPGQEKNYSGGGSTLV